MLASGKYKFIKNVKKRLSPKSNPSKKKTTRTKSNPRGGKPRKMGKQFLSIQKLGRYIRLGAFLAPAAYRMIAETNNEARLRGIIGDYTGYDIKTGGWKFENLMRGWLPYLGAVLATVGIPKLTAMIRRL